MTSTLQQLLHDLYQQLMMPDEANVVSLANRILNAKAELAKTEHSVVVEPPQCQGTNIIQRTPTDLGEVH